LSFHNLYLYCVTTGTVVFNSAGGFIPRVAGFCLQCLEAFDMPVAVNMYLTDAGQTVSAPPHTDKQDVFVCQTQGKKRWRVYSPPPPSRMPRADPLARGKATDSLSLSELEEPLVDLVLNPGQLLYVPAGFPHTTDTVSGIDEGTEPSVHLTFGVDTHIWGLNYASLRENILKRSGLTDKLLLTKLAPELYWDLQSTIHLGFLSSDPVSDESSQAIANICSNVLKKMRSVEAGRWSEFSDSESDFIAHLQCEATVLGAVQHHRQMVDLFGLMYADVAFKISPAQMDLSFFRSKVS